MGGRLNLTCIQVTFVFKGEQSDEAVTEFVNKLKDDWKDDPELVDVLLDEKYLKDVEV